MLGARLVQRSIRSTMVQQQRGFLGNMDNSGGNGGFGDDWPVSVSNTILNVCPQGNAIIVERLGKLLEVKQAGWFISIPLLDQLAYVVDMRERAIDIVPQAAITKDNVSVDVSGNVYVQFTDPLKAAYGAKNPLYAVRQHAQSAMRAAIGEMELDEILHGRAQLNTMIRGAVQEAAVNWGLEIKRYEITEIAPDRHIADAMDKQAAAERNRREKVLEAEGEKSKATLMSEGVKIRLTNESEGDLIRVRNEAEASKTRMMLEAEGESEAIILKANAQAAAIEVIAVQLGKTNGEEAAKLALAQSYVEMYGEMGSQSNTMMFSDKPADMQQLMGMATMALSRTVGAGNK